MDLDFRPSGDVNGIGDDGRYGLRRFSRCLGVRTVPLVLASLRYAWISFVATIMSRKIEWKGFLWRGDNHRRQQIATGSELCFGENANQKLFWLSRLISRRTI